MFWPRVIAAPLWHSCSLDHLKPPPFLPFIPQSPSSPDNSELCHEEQSVPLEDFLLRTGCLTQEYSQCQQDLVKIVVLFPKFHKIKTLYSLHYSLLPRFKPRPSHSLLFSVSLFRTQNFAAKDCIGVCICYSHQFRFSVPETHADVFQFAVISHVRRSVNRPSRLQWWRQFVRAKRMAAAHVNPFHNSSETVSLKKNYKKKDM